MRILWVCHGGIAAMLSSLYLDAFLRQIKTCSHSTCAPLILSGAMIWLYSIFG